MHASEAVPLPSQETSPAAGQRPGHLRGHLPRPAHLPHVRHRALRRSPAARRPAHRRHHVSPSPGNLRGRRPAAVNGQMGDGVQARRRREIRQRRRRRERSYSSGGVPGDGYGGGDV
ncbi:unnamed protein product [Linum tenue]|uniref:Uncharacterized protein n=1 Tax=Linum tenue TaxID=586396 RepID=A0AAV0R4T4_9ROSI|nr:unnamed protein product [Linum tenue]